MVIFDQRSENTSNITNTIYINPDNANGAYLATKHLIELGHTKIAHITGGDKKLSAAEKYEAFAKAMNEVNLKIDDKLVVHGDYTEEGGYKCTKEILKKEKPDAIFCGNDLMAVGAIKAIYEAGLKVPYDIAVVGFDDIEIAKYITPTLTTVKVSLSAMGELAVEKLIEMIERRDQDEIFGDYTIKTELVIRHSTINI
jgi:LacI family transcriptional regulator